MCIRDRVVPYETGKTITYTGQIPFEDAMRISDLVVDIKASKGAKSVNFDGTKIAEGVIACLLYTSSYEKIKAFREKRGHTFPMGMDPNRKIYAQFATAIIDVYKRQEFSSWLLEIIKPGYAQPIDRQTYEKTIRLFEELLQLLHPFMPFLTEEIWQNLRERQAGESIMVSLPVSYTHLDRCKHIVQLSAKYGE